jgi:hypothetical protein
MDEERRLAMGKTLEGEHRLQFVQPSMARQVYELRSETGDVIGTLAKTGFWQERATVDAPGARLEFVRRLTWNGYVLDVRSAGTGEKLAVFRYSSWLNGGTLTFAHGPVYEWRSNIWGTLFSWGTPDADEPILGFETGGFFKPSAQVHFDSGNRETVVLVFLGWFLYTLYLSDITAAT